MQAGDLLFRIDPQAWQVAAREGIPWPRAETGRLKLDDDIFRDMAKVYPVLQPLRELRQP